MHNIEREMQRIIRDNSFRISKAVLMDHFSKMYSANPNRITERCFLWIYSNGQSLLLDVRNLYIMGTVEHSFLGFYGSCEDETSFGYMIKLCCSNTSSLQGYIDKVDLESYYHHVRGVALPASSSLLRYEKGFSDNHLSDDKLGRFVFFHPQVSDNEQLEALLKKEQDERSYGLFYAVQNVNEPPLIYNCASNNVSLTGGIQV